MAASPNTTKTEEALASRLDALEPGTVRHRALGLALDFKRSWVDLAQALAEIRSRAEYREWGYRTFEAYAQHELFLKKDTALKLVRSYDFLQAHEPRALREVESPEPAPRPLPSYQALDVLAEARMNPELSEGDYRTIRDRVFEDDPPPGQVRKLVREHAPDAPREAVEEPTARLRKALQLAERLYGILLEEDVPEPIARSVEEAVGGLRRLLDE